jgi:hypothetical protein
LTVKRVKEGQNAGIRDPKAILTAAHALDKKLVS